MARKDNLTEDLRYHIELFRLFWLSLLASVSGTIGLILRKPAAGSQIFARAGIIVCVVALGMIMHLHRQIRTLIAHLQEVP